MLSSKRDLRNWQKRPEDWSGRPLTRRAKTWNGSWDNAVRAVENGRK